MKKRDIAKGVLHSLLHKLLLTNVEKLLDNFAKPSLGKNANSLWKLVNHWFDQDVIGHIANEAVPCIKWRR